MLNKHDILNTMVKLLCFYTFQSNYVGSMHALIEYHLDNFRKALF